MNNLISTIRTWLLIVLVLSFFGVAVCDFLQGRYRTATLSVLYGTATLIVFM